MFEWPYVPGALSGGLLAFAGWTAYRCWQELRGDGGSAFWAIAAVGLAWLALDEWFAIHEWLGTRYLGGIPGLNHPDDAIILGYAAVATLLGAVFWRQIAADHGTLYWFCGAAAATAIAGSIDAFGPPALWAPRGAEDGAELAAGVMAVLAMRSRLASTQAGLEFDASASIETSPRPPARVP